jgi:hypothetical protein
MQAKKAPHWPHFSTKPSQGAGCTYEACVDAAYAIRNPAANEAADNAALIRLIQRTEITTRTTHEIVDGDTAAAMSVVDKTLKWKRTCHLAGSADNVSDYWQQERRALASFVMTPSMVPMSTRT